MDSQFIKTYDMNYISQLILTEIDELIAILNPEYDFKFEFINNKAYNKYLNYKGTDLIGESFLKIIDQEYIQKTVKILKLGSSSNNVENEIIVFNKSEKPHWFEIKAKLFYNNKKQKKLLVVLKSISEQKNLERKIKENKKAIKRISKKIPEIRFWKLFNPENLEKSLNRSYRILQTVVENIPQYIFWKDKDLVYLGCNKKYAQLLGFNFPEDVIGQKDENLIKNKKKLEILKEEEIQVLKSGYSEFQKIIKWHKNNKEFFFDVNRIPLYDSTKKIVGILVTYHDLTELKESEKKFKYITEQSIMGIAIIQNGLIKYTNQQFAKLFGYKSESIKKWDTNEFLKLIHPEDRKNIKWKTSAKQRGEQNAIDHFQFKGIRKDNEVIWLDNYSKIINYKGESAYLITLIDITEKKRYQKLITELNINFLNFTIDNQTNIQSLLNTCVKLLDCNLAIFVYKNESNNTFKIITNEKKTFTYESIENFMKNTFVSKFFYEHHDFPQTFLDIDKLEYAKKDPFIKKYNIKSAYGKLIKSQNNYNECICGFFDKNPLITHDHQLVLFLISTAIEIEQKRWEVKQKLEDQNKILEEMNKFKSNLLTHTSHELKTPLISIKGFTNLLLEVHKDQMSLEMISIAEEINKGVKRLEKIIKNLLISAQLDQNLIKLKIKQDNLVPLIKSCVIELESIANFRNQSITLDLHDNLITRYDKEKIHEVVSNLLINAIKFTPTNGNIIIYSQKNKEEYIISVKDSGIGLTKAEKKRIFKKFGKIERYGKGLDLDIEGTGLGLYISKKIINLHKGRIWAVSEGRNKGSIFSFSLPILW